MVCIINNYNMVLQKLLNGYLCPKIGAIFVKDYIMIFYFMYLFMYVVDKQIAPSYRI